jgi:hypothetical protein
MPRDFELEAQLATQELKVDLERAVEQAKAIGRTQARVRKVGVQTDKPQPQKRRTRSQRQSRGPLKD